MNFLIGKYFNFTIDIDILSNSLNKSVIYFKRNLRILKVIYIIYIEMISSYFILFVFFLLDTKKRIVVVYINKEKIRGMPDVTIAQSENC